MFITTLCEFVLVYAIQYMVVCVCVCVNNDCFYQSLVSLAIEWIAAYQ